MVLFLKRNVNKMISIYERGVLMQKTFFFLLLVSGLIIAPLHTSDYYQKKLQNLLTTLDRKIAKDDQKSLSKEEFDRIIYSSTISSADIKRLDKNMSKLNLLLDTKIKKPKAFIQYLNNDSSLKNKDRKLFDADRQRVKNEEERRLARTKENALAQEKMKKEKEQEKVTKYYDDLYISFGETGVGSDPAQLLSVVKEAYYKGNVDMTSLFAQFGDDQPQEMKDFATYVENSLNVSKKVRDGFAHERATARLNAGLEADPVYTQNSISISRLAAPTVSNDFDGQSDDVDLNMKAKKDPVDRALTRASQLSQVTVSDLTHSSSPENSPLSDAAMWEHAEQVRQQEEKEQQEKEQQEKEQEKQKGLGLEKRARAR